MRLCLSFVSMGVRKREGGCAQTRIDARSHLWKDGRTSLPSTIYIPLFLQLVRVQGRKRYIKREEGDERASPLTPKPYASDRIFVG